VHSLGETQELQLPCVQVLVPGHPSELVQDILSPDVHSSEEPPILSSVGENWRGFLGTG